MVGIGICGISSSSSNDFLVGIKSICFIIEEFGDYDSPKNIITAL